MKMQLAILLAIVAGSAHADICIQNNTGMGDYRVSFVDVDSHNINRNNKDHWRFIAPPSREFLTLKNSQTQCIPISTAGAHIAVYIEPSLSQVEFIQPHYMWITKDVLFAEHPTTLSLDLLLDKNKVVLMMRKNRETRIASLNLTKIYDRR